MSEQEVHQVILSSLDGKTIKVSKKAALLSVTIKDLLEDLGDVATSIPVKPKFDTLKKIVEWMEHSKDRFGEPEPVSEEERKLPELDEWDLDFCNKLSDDEKVDMILGANHLDIKPLLDIVCIDVASLIKGQSPDELRKVLERTDKPIPEDLSEGIPGVKKLPADEEVQPEPASASNKPQKRKNAD